MDRKKTSVRMAGLLAASLSLFFLCCGTTVMLVVTQTSQTVYDQLADLPELNYARLTDTSAGTQVLLEGTLHGRAETEHDMLAYTVYRWDVRYDQEDGWEGRWQHVETVLPRLDFKLEGGTIRLAEANPALQGRLHTFIEESTEGHSVDGHHEGSLRTRGFRSGDTVTVWGTVGEENDIIPNAIYGGTRADFLAEKASRTGFLREFGTGLIGLGGLILTILIVIVLLRFRVASRAPR